MVSILKNLKQVPKFRNISDAAKIRNRDSQRLGTALKAYTKYIEALKLIEKDPNLNIKQALQLVNPGKADNTYSNMLNRNYESMLKNLEANLSKEEFAQYKKILEEFDKEKALYQSQSLTLPKSLETQLNITKSGPGVKQRDKYKQFFGGDYGLDADHKMMLKDRYALYDTKGLDTATRYAAPEYATTPKRNQEIKNKIALKINRELMKKDELVTQIRENARKPETMAKEGIKSLNQKINDVEGRIQQHSNKAADLGLELQMVDKKTGNIRSFGQTYPNMLTLKKSFDKLGYSLGGGVASLTRLLDKLNLTPRQRKLLMDAAYDSKKKPGSGPKEERERRLRLFLMRNYGKMPSYGYVKSEVPGPKTSLQRKRDEEFMKHTTFYPSRAAGGIVSKYVR